MKRIISLLLAAMMVALMLCSCSANKAGNGTSSGTAGNDAVESVESEAKEEPNVLFTWKIKIDGVEYTLPFDFSELAAQGYAINPKYDQDLPGHKYMIMGPTPKKDDLSLDVQFWNPTDDTKKVSECQIGQISFRGNSKHEVILPGDFKYDALTLTVDDIIAKYGEPDEKIDSDDFIIITYKQDVYSSIKFTVYKDEAKKDYGSLTLQNLV